MCADGPSVSNAPASQGSRSAGFEAALGDLADAIGGRKVEPICTAYLALRRAGRGMSTREILESLNGAAGGPAERMIISAFSHRQCFMCKAGANPCRTCKGTGLVDRFNCPDCGGLGLEICAFCLGTGWSDQNEMPVEVRRAAVHRRIKHAEKDLAELAKVTEADLRTSAPQLQQEQRRELASRLFRLRGRLTSLAKVETDNKDERAARFEAAAAQVDRLLEALRPPQPAAEEDQED